MDTRILIGDCRETLRTLPDASVHCVVTSPPYYGLRDYGVAGQIGLEASLDAFIETMVDTFREVRRVLRKDGVLWLNLGDSYCNHDKWGGSSGGKEGRAGVNGSGRSSMPRYKRAPGGQGGLKPKDRMMVPARTALALQADGWWLRDEIVWSKPNPMPSSVRDRTTPAHEMVYMLTKSGRYHYDSAAIAEPLAASSVARLAQEVEAQAGSQRANGGAKVNGAMKAVGGRVRSSHVAHANWADDRVAEWAATAPELRNKRSVWTVPTMPFKEAHHATFPPALIEPCIKATCPPGGVVLDPFGGAGTTALVASRLQRRAILCELNPAYAEIARTRLERDAGLFAGVAAE